MPLRLPEKHVLLTILGLLGALALAAVILLGTSDAVASAFLDEGGLVETASALGYLVVALFLIRSRGRDGAHRVWPLLWILLIMAARELDLDKRPFTLGLFKSRQYLSDQVPGLEKAISALILLAILTCLGVAAWRYGGAFLRGLRDGAAAAWYVATGGLLVVISKAMDGIGRKLAPFGIEITEVQSRRFAALEELWELGIPIAFALAVAASRRTPKHTHNKARSAASSDPSY